MIAKVESRHGKEASGMGESLSFWLFAIPWWTIGAPALSAAIALLSAKLGRKAFERRRSHDDRI